MISYNKKYTIIHTPSFQKEQEKILKYIAFNLDSPKTAKKFYNILSNKIYSLQHFPERYSKIIYKDRILRKLPIYNYIVIYEVNINARLCFYFTYFSWKSKLFQSFIKFFKYLVPSYFNFKIIRINPNCSKYIYIIRKGGFMSKIAIYVKSILIPLLIGGLVGIVTSKYIDYNSLVQPSWAPPSFLFPIVWTILYILMGISYGILKSNSLLDAKSSNIYYLQLFVNALWSIFFFAFKWRLFSFFWILLLIILVYLMIRNFYAKNKLSGLLQLPYLLWIIFASFLNLTVYLLNK